MLIIFDLDDTLIDTTGSILPTKVGHAVEKMMQEGLAVEDPLLFTRRLSRFLQGSLSSREGLAEFFSLVSFKEGKHLYEVAREEIYFGSLEEVTVSLLPGVKDALYQLLKEHRLALVTQGEEKRQKEKLKKSGLEGRFFSKMAFCRAGEKERWYRAFLEEFAILPSRVLVCGDRIERDLLPAKKLGCTTLQIKWGRGLLEQGGDMYVDHTLPDLTRLPSLVEKLHRENFLEEK